MISSHAKDNNVKIEFKQYLATISIAAQSYLLYLNDFTGLGNHYKVRRVSYPNADVFLVFFSVIRPESFMNVKEKVCLKLI